MFTATFFFLGLALCIFTGLVCFAMARSLRAASVANTIQPSPDEKAAWERLKKALMELHSRYEGVETSKEKVLRSWAGTLVICSGLCMIGVLLETRYDTFINVKSVVSGLVGKQHVPTPAQLLRGTSPAAQEQMKADQSKKTAEGKKDAEGKKAVEGKETEGGKKAHNGKKTDETAKPVNNPKRS
jgi:hypothetical protein